MKIEFDEIIVPTEKLNTVVEENMQKIQMEYKKRRRRQVASCGVAAAVLIVFFVGYCYANPVAAGKIPLIGHIFSKVQENQKYPGNFDEAAELVRGDNVCESQGVKITLSEIYCNPKALYVTAIVESEEAFPKIVKDEEDLDPRYHLYMLNTQKYDFYVDTKEYEPWEEYQKDYQWWSLDLTGKYVDEHTFIGEFRIDFSMSPLSETEIPENFSWELNINRIYCEREIFKDGEWKFETEVSVSQDEKIIDVYDYCQNGCGVSTISMTPYEVMVHLDYDESYVQPGYESPPSTLEIMLDADGKMIRDKVGMFSTWGYNLSEITVYYVPFSSDEESIEIQNNLNDDAFARSIREYLEEISIYKTVIPLEQ